MCSGCISAGAVAVTQGSVGVAVALAGLGRLRGRLTAGPDPATRRRAAYEANARFVAGLGLDPARVLGPPPGGEPG